MSSDLSLDWSKVLFLLCLWIWSFSSHPLASEPGDHLRAAVPETGEKSFEMWLEDITGMF